MASSTPIQEQIFKSRLTITYRTNITGTLQQENLPFRLLVLGEFMGKALCDAKLLADLSGREVRTIKRGSTVDDHLAEMVPVFAFPDTPDLKPLQSAIQGTARIEELTFSVPASLPADGPKKLPISGQVRFRSPADVNGVCDFDDVILVAQGMIEVTGPGTKPTFGTAKLQVHGEAVADYLDPATLLPDGSIVGLATGRDPLQSFDFPVGDLAEIVDDDGAGLGDPSAPPPPTNYRIKALPGSTGDKPATKPITLDRAVPFTSMRSFTPDELATNVPEIERVKLLQELLLFLSSELRNRPELRAVIKDLLPGPKEKPDDKVGKLAKVKTWVENNLGLLKLQLPDPKAQTGSDADDVVKGLQDALVLKLGATSTDLYAKDKDGKATQKPVSLVRWVTPPEGANGAAAAPPALQFDDRNMDVTEAARLMNAFAVLLANTALAAEEMAKNANLKWDPTKDGVLDCFGSYAQFLRATGALIRVVERKIHGYLDSVYHHPDFRVLEATWRGLAELAGSVEASDVFIDFLDASKDGLYQDLIDHDSDLFSGALFDKVYVGEYDRYGGKPFAAMIGLYEFDSSTEDMDFLRAMGRVANASHCPFVAAASPKFFHPYTTIQEVAEVADLDAILSAPRFGKWQELRDTDYAAYLGLTLPRYLVRAPWALSDRDNGIGYVEDADDNLLWGNAAILFAKNMVRSYAGSGWAQHIRGPIGGGLCEGLVSYQFPKSGYMEIQPPVEIAIPDYRELQFANNGFIPLVHKKGEAVATFFSAQSLKKPKNFVEDVNTKNAYLVTNLAYTYSITRIAHFVKRMMREYIGSTADGPYIQRVLAAWLGQYVTIVTNPDDLTLRYYPFKAATVAVEPKPGPLGWYKATIAILPHVQFEGMDVELRLEAALGGP